MSLNIPRDGFICPEDGTMYIKIGTNVIAITMTPKDLDILEKYIGFIKKKTTLKNNPITEDEREFKKAYHYFYNKERSIKQKYKTSNLLVA